MLVYNNKLLMVGGKALKYIPPRNLSIVLENAQSSMQSRYSWIRKASSSQDSWPSDFGSAIWKVSTNSAFWSADPTVIYRGTMIVKNSFDTTAKSYIFPAFFQLNSSTGLLSWVDIPESYSTTMAAGSSSSSSSFNTQLSNKIFNTKLGTFHDDREIYFGFIAWNSATPSSLYSYAHCPASNSLIYEPTMTLLEQK